LGETPGLFLRGKYSVQAFLLVAALLNLIACEAKKSPPSRPKVSEPEPYDPDIALLDEMITMLEKKVRADSSTGKGKKSEQRTAAGRKQRDNAEGDSH
jgi:hypothetical protein